VLAPATELTGEFVTAYGGHAGAQSEMTLQPPQLTFACELDPARLAALFADSPVIGDLLALGARVALMCSDLSDQRASVVRRLNAAGVPVVGIPLLPHMRFRPVEMEGCRKGALMGPDAVGRRERACARDFCLYPSGGRAAACWSLRAQLGGAAERDTDIISA
jgi:hypothetical protein